MNRAFFMSNFDVFRFMLVSTAYFPPIAHYALLLQNQNCRVEQFETFPKQTYRNRCTILTAHGVQSLSVPVVKPHGNKTLTRDIQISYETPWQQLHWRALKTAYNSSPFLLYYQDELVELFRRKYSFLLDLNDSIVEVINKLMEWEIATKRTDNFIFPDQDSRQEDHRFSFNPKESKTVGLSPYIQVFSDQFPFAENLSILDLIFNLGPEAEAYLMKIDKKKPEF